MYGDAKGILVGRGTELCSYSPTTDAVTSILDTGSATPIDFALYNGYLYFTNHGGTWRISAANVLQRAGVRLPNPLPTVATADNGALAAGKYVVAISRVNATGEESATKVIGQVSLPYGGGIHLSGMSGEVGATYRVYLTPPDGDALYLAEEFSSAFTTYVVTRQPDGAIRTSQHLAPLPGGDFIRGHAGRIYIAKDDTLRFSQPLRPHLHDPRHDFIQFSGLLRFIEPVLGGVFVGDDRGVWFLPGSDPSDMRMQLASDIPALRRSSLMVSGAHFNREVAEVDAHVAVWLSAEGYMVGKPNGIVFPLQADRLRIDPTLEGKSRLVIRRGIKQVVTLVSSSRPTQYGVAIDTTPLIEEI